MNLCIITLVVITCASYVLTIPFAANNRKKFGQILKASIINGVDSPKREFFAKIRFSDGFCGAAVINALFAVTAAHCIYNQEGTSAIVIIYPGLRFYRKNNLRIAVNSGEKFFFHRKASACLATNSVKA